MRDEVASVIPHKLEEKADEYPVESIGIEKDKLLEQLRQFFESQPLAVLATQNGIARSFCLERAAYVYSFFNYESYQKVLKPAGKPFSLHVD